MSGIAGIYRLNDRPVDPANLDRMVDRLNHRGPDGSALWSRGSVGVGHQMLHTTEESNLEVPPLVDRDRDVVLSSDARIDNREELIWRLGPELPHERPPTDGELILAAYRKWGRKCPERLLGVFAFVLWDGRKQRLFCARDPFGIKPFYYYHRPSRLFAFGSEIKALLSLEEVPEDIDETRIADYLACICSNKTYTFYKHIRRLPPGHRLTVLREDFRIESYWTLTLPEELQLGSTRDYVEIFRERFTEAVDCRLRRSPKTGAFLSGGLDSASIVSVAQEIEYARDREPLDTFSAAFANVPECDERSYIEILVQRARLRSHFVEIDAYDPVAELPDVLDILDEPMVGNLFNLTWRIGGRISDQGIRVVLDGHGGDEVLSHGYGWPEELARQGRWVKLFRELRRTRHRLNRGQLLWYYWLSYGILPLRVSKQIWSMTNYPSSRNRSDNYPVYGWQDLLRDKFIRQTNLEQRVTTYRQTFESASTERRRHYNTLRSPLQARAFEELNHKSAAHEIESQFPFWDGRLVSFCLSLPSGQKRENGIGRMILRRAMKDTVPDQIRKREDKTDFSPSVIRAVKNTNPSLERTFDEVVDSVSQYIDPSAVRTLLDRGLEEEGVRSADTVDTIGKILMLGLWLK
jgi:asparagine synthase (glutamine-hydrolysing)